MSRPWTRRLLIAGLVLMLAGLVDPMEGSVVILAGTALAALGGVLSGGRFRQALVVAAGLVLVGVATLWIMSGMGGIGGSTGRSLWWALALLPYPVGWLLGMVAVVRQLRLGAAPPAA